MRNAQRQAGQAADQASAVGANLGSEGQAIGSQITPFLTSEMLHPQGIGQEGLAAETGAALGGAGGAASGLVGMANQRAATSRNAGGFQAALDDVSRNRMKAAAGASEGIQAGNENLKQQQMQEGAKGLQGLYGTDTSGMLSAMGQVPEDVNSEVNAGKSGWLQNTLGIIAAINGGAAAGTPGGKLMGKIPGMG